MSQIKLKLLDEKLKYYIEPPYITNGNRGINTISVIFDKNWNLENTFKFLYIIKNNSVIEKVSLENDSCNLPNSCLEEAGEIELCIVAENENETIVKTSSRLKLKIYEGINKDDIIKEYPEIKLYRGCTSIVKFDFSNFQFYNGSVELTIKRRANSDILYSKIFTEQKEYEVIFGDNFTAGLNYSEYLYDLIYIAKTGGEQGSLNMARFPLCLPSKIRVMEMVNDG